MTLYRLGGDNPCNPQVWITARSVKSALECYISIKGDAEWKKDVFEFLTQNPDISFNEFIQNFVEEERNESLVRRMEPRFFEPRPFLVYQHGSIELFKVGSYKGGCWIISHSSEEAIGYYKRIAGEDLPGDSRLISIEPSLQAYYPDFEEYYEWDPIVELGGLREDIYLELPCGLSVCSSGEEHIMDAIRRNEQFPCLLGYDLDLTLYDPNELPF